LGNSHFFISSGFSEDFGVQLMRARSFSVKDFEKERGMVVQKLAEALAAWKGPRHMTNQQVNQPSFPIARAARLAGKTSSVAPAQLSDDREPLEDRIRCRAYLLAENAGFPEGRADEFWYRAEQEVRRGDSRRRQG
jgi:hypothetical protein